MRKEVLFIGLRDHLPSDKLSAELDLWFQHNDLVVISKNIVKSNRQMKLAKKKFKFDDLPCLIVTEKKKNGRGYETWKFYGQGAYKEIQRMKNEYKRGRKK